MIDADFLFTGELKIGVDLGRDAGLRSGLTTTG
jgi:hypothetical protein